MNGRASPDARRNTQLPVTEISAGASTLRRMPLVDDAEMSRRLAIPMLKAAVALDRRRRGGRPSVTGPFSR